MIKCDMCGADYEFVTKGQGGTGSLYRHPEPDECRLWRPAWEMKRRTNRYEMRLPLVARAEKQAPTSPAPPPPPQVGMQIGTDLYCDPECERCRLERGEE